MCGIVSEKDFFVKRQNAGKVNNYAHFRKKLKRRESGIIALEMRLPFTNYDLRFGNNVRVAQIFRTINVCG